MKRILATLTATVALMAGCGSSGDGASDSTGGGTTPSGSEESASVASSPADTSPAEITPPASNDDLTGFGATVDVFSITHEASKDPDLAEGCCYGPLVTTADGEQVNEYNLAGNSGDRVVNLTRTFPPGTTQRVALAAVARDDLPTDIRLTKSKDQGECKVFVYRSKTLGAAAPTADLGPVVSVALYPPPDPNGAAYNPARIEQVIELTGDGTEFGC